jgi:hypothetical protein
VTELLKQIPIPFEIESVMKRSRLKEYSGVLFIILFYSINVVFITIVYFLFYLFNC